MKISLIIPIKNRANLIGETLDCIFNQTLLPFEVIVVDDGSEDELNTVIHSYGDKVTLLQNEGRGPGAARNTGLKKASGDFIKFFDSDDLMTKNMLEVQAKKLLESRKGYVTSPYFYAKKIDNNKWEPQDGAILNYNSFPIHKPLTYWMIKGLFITIPGMLFTKDFIASVGLWPEKMITSEDWAYLWRIAMIEPFPAHTNECAFLYRVHESQSTGSNLTERLRDKEKFEVLKEIYTSDIRSSSQFSFFDKVLFRNKFYQLARVTSDKEFKNELAQLFGKTQFVIWQYLRIQHKYGRLKTKTSWQPMHGVCSNKKQLETYLKMI
ncbi:glycosyltransferase family 2 protein [Pinibacter soli]|uniref:Glycosyltransferase family A protein n=1 Tax=Pinibacter soli TaxID=3044211 RepID=A0ABT6R7U9_9BACT|nr:glycosyltransferase family A protein [Pinibacter soli]MDI3318627.1 glycosyltransferase family A protein [Pinibacter soli]